MTLQRTKTNGARARPTGWVEDRLIVALRRATGLPRPAKFAVLLVNDAMLCTLAVWIAFSLRLGIWQLSGRAVTVVIITSLAAWLPIFLLRGTYRTIVRFLGTRTALNMAVSCMLVGITTSLFYVLAEIANVPRTIGAIHAIVFAGLLIMSRLVAGYLLFDLPNQYAFAGRVNRVLIYGAGSTGRQLATSMRHEPGMVLQGYIDDDARLAGHRLDGVPIHSGTNPARLVEEFAVTTVLLAMPKISRKRREEIVRKFANISVHVLTLPAMGDFISGSISLADLREIEVADLLGRDPVPPINDLFHKATRGLTVMVTGAGGSIGSELCRQLAAAAPAKLILVDMSEHALYSIENELLDAQHSGAIDNRMTISTELGNVADRGVTSRLFGRYRPDTVFHAAAYKHVPLLEENAISGMRNNIFGTLNCALEAENAGARRFVLVSTDKAVRPTNVMGATKRACEMILQALSAKGSETTFAMVRFGNVLGSSGSVVPRFQRQIRAGGPVTLTHKDITRYFMTIPEAAQLVVQAAGMAQGGDVYVLDMGEPVRIFDLACTMINLSGLSVRSDSNPDGDIEIAEIGLRKGEKLYEELLIGNSPQATQHPRIMRATEPFLEWHELEPALSRLNAALERADKRAALAVLSALVPEYSGEQSAAPAESVAAPS